MTAAGNELGLFLRARRRSLTPARAGLDVTGPRRMAGLRREEVAKSAGVSVHYYVRLEQGRARRPSPQVVSALGRALHLSDDEMLHLVRLSGQGVDDVDTPVIDDVTLAAMEAVFAQLHGTVAYASSATGTVLRSTALAQAVCPGFLPGVNAVVWLFLSPAARTVLPDIDTVRRESTARMRFDMGSGLAADELPRVIDYLLERSAVFRELWQRHEVLKAWRRPLRFCHPSTGIFSLERIPFDLVGTPGYRLHMLHPVDPTAELALARIASL